MEDTNKLRDIIFDLRMTLVQHRTSLREIGDNINMLADYLEVLHKILKEVGEYDVLFSVDQDQNIVLSISSLIITISTLFRFFPMIIAQAVSVCFRAIDENTVCNTVCMDIAFPPVWEVIEEEFWDY